MLLMRILLIVLASVFAAGCGKKDDGPAKSPPPQVEAAPDKAAADEPEPAQDQAPAAVANAAPNEAAPAPEKAPEPRVADKAAAPANPSSWDSDDELVWPMDQTLLAAAAPAAGQESKAFGIGGGGNAVNGIWKKLEGYQSSYLKTWADALAEPPASATEVVDAFNELAFAVTGPQGFWRNTLPKKWLGCENDPESEPCQKLSAEVPKLRKWDKIQAKLSKMSAGKAARFLGRNQGRIMAYFDNYVPQEPSGAAMKDTGFYKDNLEGLLD